MYAYLYSAHPSIYLPRYLCIYAAGTTPTCTYALSQMTLLVHTLQSPFFFRPPGIKGVDANNVSACHCYMAPMAAQKSLGKREGGGE